MSSPGSASRPVGSPSTLLAIPLLVVTLAWGQGGNRPASTKESGQTSGRGQTAVEQTAKGHGATLTGCLGGPNDAGAYTLTNDQYQKSVEVGDAEGVDVKALVWQAIE